MSAATVRRVVAALELDNPYMRVMVGGTIVGLLFVCLLEGLR